MEIARLPPAFRKRLPERVVPQENRPNPAKKRAQIPRSMKPIDHRRKSRNRLTKTLSRPLAEVRDQLANMLAKKIDPAIRQERRQDTDDLLIGFPAVAQHIPNRIMLDSVLTNRPRTQDLQSRAQPTGRCLFHGTTVTML